MKEELRNKRAEMWCGVTGGGFALLIAAFPWWATFGLFATVWACLCLGIKDVSSGRKVVGWSYGILAAIIFTLVSGAGFRKTRCMNNPETENAGIPCAEVDEVTSELIRITSGMTLLFVLINPMLGWIGREKLRNPGKFTLEFGDKEPAKAPNRWFEKEQEFETFVLNELAQSGVGKRQTYEWVCKSRGITPEIHGDERYEAKSANVLAKGDWHCVYTLIERCWALLGVLHKDHFERRINDYLRESQIGWVVSKGE